ncbi:hypothetical protein CC2G_001668 [Coprinopsis cinerea AmutBmut pab1-1]|nr:hypothetical protein CC2G_001668 [Coprinopsis cinerea AmutBmut pab1-1]
MLPPTTRLPSIKAIASTPSDELRESIESIRKIFNPPVRASRRRRAAQDETDFEALRSDPFERTYVITWLTALVSRYSEYVDERLLADASALLAICAGTACAGVITRLLSFQSACGQLSIQLRDVPLDNHDYGSVGAQTWGGACVMAEMIAEEPGRFGLPVEGGDGSRPFRILELGAGTGLVSLTIAEFYRRMGEEGRVTPPVVEVVATDFYPTVLDNLAANIANNGFHDDDDNANSRVRLRHCALDWSTFASSVPSPPLDEPFDMIFGADIVYEEKHAVWIKECLAKLLPRGPLPGAIAPTTPFFHLIIPLRATHTFESGTIETVFGGGEEGDSEEDLVIHSREMITCEETECGKEEEVVYALYRIGWRK